MHWWRALGVLAAAFGLASCAPFSRDIPYATLESRYASGASQYIELSDGVRMHYRVHGPATAPVLVLVHGFGASLHTWEPWVERLQPDYRIVSVDLPGHGLTRAPARYSFSASSNAELIDELAQHLNVRRFTIVGHSMGGAIATRLALDAPARVASLVLVNPAGLGAEINAGYIEGFVQAASRRELKPVVEQLFADPALVNRQLLDDLLKYKRLDGVPELLQALAGAMFTRGRQAEQPGLELEAFAGPVTVVWGEADQVIPVAHAQHAPPGASVQVLAGAGHMVMMERANDFNALLRKHLSQG